MTKPNTEWEEEFNDRWYLHTKQSTLDGNYQFTTCGEEVKSFISNLLSEQEKSCLEALSQMNESYNESLSQEREKGREEGLLDGVAREQHIRQAERERCVGILEGMKETRDVHDDGWNYTLDEAKKRILQ